MKEPIEIHTAPEVVTLADGPAPRSAADVVAVARASLAREPGLVVVGVGGLLLSLLCLVAVAVRGSFIPPEGKMLDAATFTFGVGLFTLTIALILPLAGYSEKARRRWRRTYYVFAVYGLLLESIQSFRGLDPRFTETGGTVDVIAGAIFGFTAGLLTLAFLILGLRFFRSEVLADQPTLRLGIRYGSAAVALSFGVGIAMSVMSGREAGEAGNLLLAHALGVHGIQFVPAVALLLIWAGVARTSTKLLHAAGIGWLAACAAALIQALLGRPPLEMSVLTTLIVVGLTAWAVVAGYSFFSWRQTAEA